MSFILLNGAGDNVERAMVGMSELMKHMWGPANASKIGNAGCLHEWAEWAAKTKYSFLTVIVTSSSCCILATNILNSAKVWCCNKSYRSTFLNTYIQYLYNNVQIPSSMGPFSISHTMFWPFWETVISHHDVQSLVSTENENNRPSAWYISN